MPCGLPWHPAQITTNENYIIYLTTNETYAIVVYENGRKREMDFCLSGKGSEARSSQTATRLLVVLWFESLLLVWRLHSRTIRPVARFLFAGGKGNRVLFERDLSFKGS